LDVSLIVNGRNGTLRTRALPHGKLFATQTRTAFQNGTNRIVGIDFRALQYDARSLLLLLGVELLDTKAIFEVDAIIREHLLDGRNGSLDLRSGDGG
jgi:hypothetical protein